MPNNYIAADTFAFVCFKGSSHGSTSSVFCDDRSKYVLWDAYHSIITRKLIGGDDGY